MHQLQLSSSVIFSVLPFILHFLNSYMFYILKCMITSELLHITKFYSHISLLFLPFPFRLAIPTAGRTLPILEVNGRILSGHTCIARYLAEEYGKFWSIFQRNVVEQLYKIIIFNNIVCI